MVDVLRVVVESEDEEAETVVEVTAGLREVVKVLVESEAGRVDASVDSKVGLGDSVEMVVVGIPATMLDGVEKVGEIVITLLVIVEATVEVDELDAKVVVVEPIVVVVAGVHCGDCPIVFQVVVLHSCSLLQPIKLIN